MSKILEKAFDASKKIIRSIFNGSPNLITTSDLNRQFEALKHQADKLDEKTGFLIEGGNLEFKLEGSTLKVNFAYSTMEYKGCVFYPDQKITVDTNFTASAPYAYFCLVADKETLTYDTDVTHEIAGAKFADGTSMRAADQIVYKNERFVLTHSVESLNNLVGIIAFFRLINGKVYASENWTDFYSPLRVKDGSGSVGSDFETSQKYPIKLGDTYDVALGKLQGFLGDAKVYTGCWTYNHASVEEMVKESYELTKKKQPAYLVKDGSVFKVYLDGLSRQSISTLTLEEMASNIKSFLIGIITLDVEGDIIFDNIPDTYNIGKLIGASVTFADQITITSKSTDSPSVKTITGAHVDVGTFYKPKYDLIGNAFVASFSSRGFGLTYNDYNGIDYDNISVGISNSRGITVVLTFANKDYFQNLL